MGVVAFKPSQGLVRLSREATIFQARRRGRRVVESKSASSSDQRQYHRYRDTNNRSVCAAPPE